MSENLSNVAAFAACGTTDPNAAPACGIACGTSEPAPACGTAEPAPACGTSEPAPACGTADAQ